MKMKKEVKIGVGLVFLAFCIFLAMQFRNVFLYYDDYGYLSLSYGYTVPGVTGSRYTLSQLMVFLGRHYFLSNGRLLYLFLFCFLYMAGGLAAVQVFMAACVLAVLLLAYGAASDHSKPESLRAAVLAAFICLLYGTVGIQIQRLGTYWFAAGFLYVVPAVTFLLLAALYYGTMGETPGTWKKAVCAALAFLAAFSQEEWLVAVIGFICMVIVSKYRKKYRVCGYDFAVLAAAVAGALPILTSPAVGMRMDNSPGFSSLPFFQKILTNVTSIIDLFFSSVNLNYLGILLIMLMALGVYVIRMKMKLLPFNIAYLACSAAIAVYLFLKLNRHILGPEDHSVFMIWILLFYLAASAAQILRILHVRNHLFMGMLFLSAVLSSACLVVVPELPPRVFLPFIYLSFTLLGYLFCLIFLERKSIVWGLAGLAVLAAVSIPNLAKIYRGYSINYKVLMYNDGVIRAAVKRIRQGGGNIKVLRLYRNPDPLCSCDMVYDENFKYMIYWMDEYYDLPPDVQLEYEPIAGSGAWLEEH